MLTLSETEGRSCSSDRKKQRVQKKRKYDKSQKRRILSYDASKGTENKIMEEKSKKDHNLSEVQFTSEDKDQEFQQSTSDISLEPNCESSASISCVGSVDNENKYVIITLLQPDIQEASLEQSLVNMENASGTDDTSNVRNCSKIQKKVILLPTDMVIDSSVNVKTELEDVIQAGDFAGPLRRINAEEFEPLATDNKEQREISNWIKRFQSLVLCHTETGKPYVKCPACSAMFFKSTSFQRHLPSHLYKSFDGSLYVCAFCKFGDKDASAIFTHLFTHQDQCEVCNMNLTRKNSYKKHWEMTELSFTIKRDRWGRFVCALCKLGFDLSHQLQKHWFKHSCKSKKTHQCNSCSGLFDSEKALDNHKCLRCPVCDKICDSVHRLKAHTRYEKHYLFCSICSYEFILAVDHEKHLALHKKIYHLHKNYNHCLEAEDGNSFQCELCGKIFNSVSGLVLHIHRDHKIQDVNKNVGDDELSRITLSDGKEQEASFEFINNLKSELKCEVDFERACEQVLEAQSSRTTMQKEGLPDNNVDGGQCEPVSLCWNRYSISEMSDRKTD